jgi:hypothetical protein
MRTPRADVLHGRSGTHRPDRTPGEVKPLGIIYIADARDLKECAEHLQQVLGAVLGYLGAIVTDTDHVAPGGSIDWKYLLGLISDVAGDVAGSISNAADDLAAGRV